MIVIKTKAEIDGMRKAGKIAARALELAGKSIFVGISTYEIDSIVREYIYSNGAKPSFLKYNGFPASACISVNDVVIHGIPNKKQLIADGDIVSVDVGAFIGGFHGDCAETFCVGNVSPEAKALTEVTKQSFFEGINYAKEGMRIGDIGAAVSDYVQRYGYLAVRQYVGHGVGFDLHEDPSVPNYGVAGRGIRLMKGMTIAVEPMINQGTYDVEVLNDGWTVITKDGKLSAHYENTIAITSGKPQILTQP